MIPRIIHQVWIGPLDPPLKWMKTWQEKNPDWEYVLWDNEKVFSRTWRNQWIVDHYVRRYNEVVQGKSRVGNDLFISARGHRFIGEKATLFAWHVIADVLRYEILHEYGGYMPGADAVCFKSIDDKFEPWVDLYTVRTGHLFIDKYRKLVRKYKKRRPNGYERVLLRRLRTWNASPILASSRENSFLNNCINELNLLRPGQLGEAVDTTGNVFMGKMLKKYKPENLKVVDYKLKKERDPENDYSIHYSGTTRSSYYLGR